MKKLIVKLTSKPMTDIESALLERLHKDPDGWLFNQTDDGLFAVNRGLGITVKSKAGPLGRFKASVGELDFGPFAAFSWHEAAIKIANDRQQLRKSRESDSESARLRQRLNLK